MDPNETLYQLAQELDGGATAAARDLGHYLVDWITHGGYVPTNVLEFPIAWRYVRYLQRKEAAHA